MKRREFLQHAAASVLGAGASGASRAFGAISAGQLDRFGGWKKKTFEATGFFRTEHDGNRWWFVTPDGNAFISFGVNHYHKYLWTQDYNRAHWVKTFGATQPYDQA
jgi:hypothetical protein